jgi:hypothetical protein
MEQSPSWVPNGHSASQEFPALYGTGKFINVFTRARHWSLSWAVHPIHTFPPHFPTIISNIIIPSTPRFSNQDAVLVRLDSKASPWRWRQRGPLKCRYPSTTLHGITTPKTSPRTFRSDSTLDNLYIWHSAVVPVSVCISTYQPTTRWMLKAKLSCEEPKAHNYDTEATRKYFAFLFSHLLSETLKVNIWN